MSMDDPSFVVVKGAGIDPTGVDDSTPAIQDLIDTVPPGGGTVYFPAGTYKIKCTLDLGHRPGLRLVGAGRSGQSSGVGWGSTVLHYVGTGYCIQWAVGASTALFSGVTIQSLHIEGTGSRNPSGGIYLGNSSNSLIAECTVSDFRNDTVTAAGIKIGDTSTSGAQYNTIRDCTLSKNDIGVDNWDANGTRIMGGFIEDEMLPKPRKGTYGVRFRAGADTGIMVGVVVQGAETLVYAEAGNQTLSACRYEGFTTAIRIAASFCNVMGGSMNNYIMGGGGTGVLIEATALATFVMLPGIGATGAPVIDDGEGSTVLADVRLAGRIAHRLTGPRQPLPPRTFFYPVSSPLETHSVVVNEVGDVAQSPRITLQSNGIDGPVIGTDDWFTTMFLDHVYSPEDPPGHRIPTRLLLKVGGEEVLALGNGKKLGFFGKPPIEQPTGTPAKATPGDLDSAVTLLNDLREKLIALGLIAS